MKCSHRARRACAGAVEDLRRSLRVDRRRERERLRLLAKRAHLRLGGGRHDRSGGGFCYLWLHAWLLARARDGQLDDFDTPFDGTSINVDERALPCE